ncbi:MAG: serine/threonine protein kinase [Pyrinomonadaceae bacterium]
MANILTGTIIAEKYRLGELLKNDGLADLYDARHILMDKQVSVRVLRPSVAADSENVAAFFESAKTASRVADPHVLNISDFGTDHEGFVYAIYEPLDGKPLKELLVEEGAFPVYSAAEVGRQASEALSVSHAQGQIHGNLSTENILLTGNEGIDVKLFDFGSQNALMKESTEAANFAYLAPEQCSGSDVSDERGDVYSLGAILYELLAGVPPFVGEKPTEVMLKHIEEMPPPLAAFRTDLPEGLEQLIVKALSKNPEMRQQTALEFTNELNVATQGVPLSASTEPKNNLWKTAFIVLVGMSLLSAFLIYGTYTKQTNPATALQPDANGLPVQPINPATGSEEQSLAAMPALTVDAIANSNLSQPPGTLPGGDGYNPWGSGGAPPGAPQYIPQGGQVVTIDPTTGSPFMPPDGIVLVPVPVNSNTNKAKPSPTPKTSANSAPQTTPTPKVESTPAKPTSTPRPTPAVNKPAIDDKSDVN